MKTFKSKIDIWLIIVLTLTVIASIAGAFSIVYADVTAINIVIATFVFLIGAVLPIWLIMTTEYVVSDEYIKVSCGPFKWDVNISSISDIKETKNPLSSPALSLDRLEIHYNNGKKIIVSPKNKIDFLSAIGRKEI